MYRILIVEDDPIMRKLLHKTLTPEGYECIMAANASAGMEACVRDRPDLLMLDVCLPDYNGIDLCRKIKADPSIRHIPVILITGEASEVERRMEGLEAGADDYILKPFKSKELLSRMKRIIKSAAKPTH